MKALVHPLLIICFHPQVKTTEHIPNTINPGWDCFVEFPVKDFSQVSCHVSYQNYISSRVLTELSIYLILKIFRLIFRLLKQIVFKMLVIYPRLKIRKKKTPKYFYLFLKSHANTSHFQFWISWGPPSWIDDVPRLQSIKAWLFVCL